MLEKVVKFSLAKKIAAFAFAFAGVLFLLALGFFIGLEASNLGTVVLGSHSERTFADSILRFADTPGFGTAFRVPVFLAAAVTLLLCWTVLLLASSLRNKRVVEKTIRALRKEAEAKEQAHNELRSIHRELSRTSGQLGGLLEGSTDLIAAVDKNYELISFNNSYREIIRGMFGVDIEVGSNVLDAQSQYPELRQRSKELWDKALSGVRFTDDQVVQRDTGETVYFELSYNPIKSETGEIIGACQTTRDVTERIQTAEKLKQERDFVSAAFDVSSSLVVVLDREGRIIRFNRAAEKLSGFTAEEVRNRVFWNVLLPADDIKRVKAEFRKVGTEQDPGDEKVNFWITKDEQLKLISWKTACIRDESGSIEYIVTTGIDITEKNEFETARNRMLAILENSDDFISISDLQGQIVYLNRAGRLLLGLSPEAQISQLRLQTCHPEWAQNLIQLEGIPSAVKYGSWLGNTALRTVDDVEIPTSQMILSHKSPEGRVEFLSTVARNRTSEKLLEEELAEARDAAIYETNMKSEFLAHMSHEIRTPMNGIVGIAELLSGTRLDEEQQDYVKSIANSADALLTIINDILDFSKIEAGKLEFENKRFDLRETAESVLDLFALQAYQKRIELSLLLHRDVPSHINGDAGRLRQVLTNLVGNAVKFTNDGEVAARISIHDGRLKFSVRDTGIGIPEADQSVLFTAFGQAHATMARKFGGTGLGLAISKQLVTLMGGEIGFKSEQGVGSDFFFTVPLPEAASNETTAYKNLRGTGLSRILVVGENPTNRGFLVYQLKAMGLSAEEASSARSGLEMLRSSAALKEPFDAVIVDFDLTRSGALSIAEKMRSEPGLRKTNMVILMNPNDRSNFELAKRSGVKEFIFKPIKTRNVVRALIGKDENALPSVQFSQAQEETSNPKTKTDNQPTDMNNSKTNILIAEDNLVNQKVILNQVTRLGYNVDLVENGQQVLDALALKRYAMVLMDCQMPVMDGFEATSRIRAIEETTGEHLPIIAVTAHAIAGDRAKCMAHGMDDYISKPTDQQTLREVIGKWSAESPSELPLQAPGTGAAKSESLIGNISEEDRIRARLKELSEACGQDVVDECIDLFVKDTGSAVRQLENAFRCNDRVALSQEAHKLKGSSANMGATRLPKICQTIMDSAEKGETQKAGILIKQIGSEIRFLLPVYQKIRETAYEEVPALELVV